MPGPRRAYRSREESIAIVRELLRHGRLTTSQVATMAKANRTTTLAWLRDAEREGAVVRSTDHGPGGGSVWTVAVGQVMTPAPEGPIPFEDLCRRLRPRRWHPASELKAYREDLPGAVAAELLETCRSWYTNRPGRPRTLYKLTVGGEIRAGLHPLPRGRLEPTQNARNG